MSEIKHLILGVVLLSEAVVTPATTAPVQDLKVQWRIRHEAGLEALRQGRNADAASSLISYPRG